MPFFSCETSHFPERSYHSFRRFHELPTGGIGDWTVYAAVQVQWLSEQDRVKKVMSDEMSLVVVIATYNEIATLPSLTREIWERLPDANILVVDDNSPDGTGEWVSQLQEHEPRISLRHRPGKEGLGRAAIDGILQAIESSPRWVATMDADHSHDPGDLLTMFNRAQDESRYVDLVIGSRYVRGGRIENWSARRRVASRLVNGVARWGLGLTARDNTGALRVYRTTMLRVVRPEKMRSRGHVYLEEILMRLKRNGASIVEVPITFRDRIAGESSLNFRGLLDNFRELILLVFQRGRD